MMQKNENQDDRAAACGLPDGAMLLQGQYEIKSQLAIGGFGMTYLARDSLARQVVVKECFPDGLCVRDGLLVMPASEAQQSTYQKIVWNFVAEARRLARLKHPNIVAVHQVFEENHTAYMAMDFVDGEELIDILEITPGRLTPDLLEHCLRQTLDAVAHLHEMGFLHRDISPDNLLLDRDNHLTLIDFGAARENTKQSLTAATFLLAVKDGYSPHEFYIEDATQDSSSDLYALAATFYHLITGETPPDSWSRHEEIEAGHGDPYVPLTGGDWAFDPAFLKLIDQALSVNKSDRIQSAAEWIEQLDASEPDSAAAAGPVKSFAASPKRAEKFIPRVAEVDLQALSKLVEDTNTVVASSSTGTKPRRKVKSQDTSIPAAKARRPKQPVDLFGNPIEDVDAWMREQDRILKAKAKLDAVKVSERSDEHEVRPKSLIGRLLTGTLIRSRNSATTV
ncbi:serine/threonine protein kinase [Marimonas arenosa]|uniref:Serine/threonine protein kinase n=1 Tax=Marimonas arenosa TaxID=1795305 RepID=A0AAE3WE52_9RHOB|nr:serine/threonine-protein kinase [Marimonas arenosa]MDQ2090884.1 serine/threonine protein kinase [Marimonas arenosa]